MAKESVNFSVSPDITKSGGGNSRRNSLGKASSSKGVKIVIPHYLRASTGSCHDFCKYGRNNGFVVKERRPIRKRIIAKLSDGRNPEESAVLEEKRKTLVVKKKAVPVMNVHRPESPAIIKQEVFHVSLDSDTQNSVENEVLQERKTVSGIELKLVPYSKTQLPDTPDIIKRVVSTKLVDGRPREAEVQAEKKKNSAVKLNSSPKSKLHLSEPSKIAKSKPRLSDPPKVPNSKNHLSDPPKVPNLKIQLSDPPKVPNLKAHLSDTPIVTKSKIHLSDSPEVVKHRGSPSSGKVQLSSNRVSSKAKDLNFSETHTTPLKLKSVLVKPLSSPNPSGASNGKRSGTPKVAVNKVLVPPTASLSQKPSINRIASLNARNNKSPKVVLHLKNQSKTRKSEMKQPNNGQVQEKTLYVIKMETESYPSESDKKRTCADGSSLPPSSSPKSSSQPNSPDLSSHGEEYQKEFEYATSETDEYSISENGESLEGEHEGWSRKAGMLYFEEENSEPMKVKFRRGKVVNLLSDNNSPRRLKFRRGRVLEGNQILNGNDRRRNYKRTEFENDSNGTKHSSEIVILRHQDMQDKKDALGLFNNVIEETASKLVETRKSKVKALVGAFETVISLQETKPSANSLPSCENSRQF